MRRRLRVKARLGSTVRVVAAILGLLVTAFAVSGFVAVRTFEGELIQRIDDRIVDDARTTALALGVVTIAEIAEVGEGARTGSSASALVLLDGDGDVVLAAPSGSRTDPDPLPDLAQVSELADPSGAPFTVGSDGGSFDYRAVTAVAGETTVIVASPLDGVQETVDVLVKRLHVIGLAVVGVLGTLIWAVVAAANRQTDHMIDTAARIGAGDLSARIDDLPTATAGGRLGHALNDMLHQLEAAFVAREASEDRLRRFAADASHELRTPLTHIRGYAELLRSGAASTPEEQVLAVGRIEGEATRMAALVEDLLLLTRLDQGRPLGDELVDLSALIAESVADARAVESDRPISLDLPAEQLTVNGDEPRLRQVLANLLANVRAHTPATAPVHLSMARHDGEIVLTVADGGPGMTPADAARAFDRFYRPEDSRSRASGGSGLGLAITAGIVHAHGGTITLDTAAGSGATFTITLPRSSSLGPVPTLLAR